MTSMPNEVLYSPSVPDAARDEIIAQRRAAMESVSSPLSQTSPYRLFEKSEEAGTFLSPIPSSNGFTKDQALALKLPGARPQQDRYYHSSAEGKTINPFNFSLAREAANSSRGESFVRLETQRAQLANINASQQAAEALGLFGPKLLGLAAHGFHGLSNSTTHKVKDDTPPSLPRELAPRFINSQAGEKSGPTRSARTKRLNRLKR